MLMKVATVLKLLNCTNVEINDYDRNFARTHYVHQITQLSIDDQQRYEGRNIPRLLTTSTSVQFDFELIETVAVNMHVFHMVYHLYGITLMVYGYQHSRNIFSLMKKTMFIY